MSDLDWGEDKILLSTYVYMVIEEDYDLYARYIVTLDPVKAHKMYVAMRAAYIAHRMRDDCGGMYSRDLIWLCPYELEQVELDKFNDDHTYELSLIEEYDKGDKRRCYPAPNPPPRDPNATPVGLYSGVYTMWKDVEDKAEQYDAVGKLLDEMDKK